MLLNTLPDIQRGDFKSLARGISGIENHASGSWELMQNLPPSSTPVIGITGPPGAGKSTIVNVLIGELLKLQKKIAILCVDPSSPFHRGAFLGDRIRMNQWTRHTDVYIRSLSSRGSLGGLHPRIFEITDLLRAAPFDYILIETVGIGQSEIDISGIADYTILVLTPGSGDEIQALKAGALEIANLVVVNKSDHPDTRRFVQDLRSALHLGSGNREILETIATESKGIAAIAEMIQSQASSHSKKIENLAEKAFRLILEEKMKGIDKKDLSDAISAAFNPNFNIYRFVENYTSGKK